MVGAVHDEAKPHLINLAQQHSRDRVHPKPAGLFEESTVHFFPRTVKEARKDVRRPRLGLRNHTRESGDVVNPTLRDRNRPGDFDALAGRSAFYDLPNRERMSLQHGGE